jgi:hypothetical protein
MDTLLTVITSYNFSRVHLSRPQNKIREWIYCNPNGHHQTDASPNRRITKRTHHQTDTSPNGRITKRMHHKTDTSPNGHITKRTHHQTDTSPNSVVKIVSFGCAAKASKNTETVPLCQYIVSERNYLFRSPVSPIQCWRNSYISVNGWSHITIYSYTVLQQLWPHSHHG